MVDGLSVRKAAQSAGIDRTTSFRWRHRLLQLPAQENDTELVNIVEADETYFLESFKGQRHLPRKARQRGGVGATRGTGNVLSAIITSSVVLSGLIIAGFFI